MIQLIKQKKGVKPHRIIATVLTMAVLTAIVPVYPQNVDEMDRRAGEYLKQREFSKALAEWLGILMIQPDNDTIQKKIELLYEEKHRKDLAYQKARFHYRKAAAILEKDIKGTRQNFDIALANFIIAYRIDPKDAGLQLMREDLKKLEEEVLVVEARKRLTEELKKKYFALMDAAETNMKAGQFREAIKDYKEVLKLVPEDSAALEGIRNARLAISNRLKYEKIMSMLAGGIALFKEEKYNEARVSFVQVLDLDSKNSQAKNHIRKIDDILEDKRNFELKRVQAEQFYISGIANVREKKFDEAEDDYRNVLSLIPNYKDTKIRLADLDRLRKEYEEEQRLLRLRRIDREFQNGLVAYANGEYKVALSYFEKTLALDKKNDLAKTYIERVKEAIRDIEEETVDRDSPYYDIINSLIVSGRQLYERGEFIASREQWDKILRLFPKNRIALEYTLKTELKMNPKRFDEFARNIVIDGREMLARKKYKPALKKFELIKDISPGYPEIDNLIAEAKKGTEVVLPEGVSRQEIENRYAIGIRFYQQGGADNIQKALVQFRWIVANDPNNVRALITLNKIQSQMRLGGAGAVETQAGLSEKQKELVRKYYYNGINFYTNNQFEKAIQEWRKVLLIDPNHEKARNNIRKSLVLLGR